MHLLKKMILFKYIYILYMYTNIFGKLFKRTVLDRQKKCISLPKYYSPKW